MAATICIALARRYSPRRAIDFQARVAFGRALDSDPGCEAAATGLGECEEKLKKTRNGGARQGGGDGDSRWVRVRVRVNPTVNMRKL